ncbi:MAG: radical SAM protein, partial [Exilispira sp.]
MKNSLVLFFNSKLFQIYSEQSLRNYLVFLRKKLDIFNDNVSLNLFVAYEENIKKFINEFFSDYQQIIYNSSLKSFFESYNIKLVEYGKKIDSELNTEENFTILLSASYPFFSISKNKFILEDAEKYLVDYYYGENFPEGIIAEVFKNSIIEQLIKISKDSDQYHHNAIFEILLRNISLFDIDLLEGFNYYLPYRISLSIEDYSSLPLIYYIMTGIKPYNIDDLKNLNFFNLRDLKPEDIKGKLEPKLIQEWDYIEKILMDLENLYTIPKTYIIELSSKCNFSCNFCISKEELIRESEYLDKNRLFNFIDKNKNYLIDSKFIIGGFGEPFLHKDFNQIINYLSKNNQIYIETNGSFLTKDFFNNFDNPENIYLIISLDAIKEETYKALGKKMIFSLLLKTINELLEKYPDNIYISFIRIPQNDDEIEEFYSYFQKYENNIIFRKFNSYSNKLENLEVADLTPVQRFPCYHLRREVFILSDGKIALCYSDFNGNLINLNIEDKMEKIIEKY